MTLKEFVDIVIKSGGSMDSNIYVSTYDLGDHDVEDADIMIDDEKNVCVDLMPM